MKILAAALLVLSQAAWAANPGTPVTVTLPDGSVVSGVVVSSGTATESSSPAGTGSGSAAAPTPQAKQPPPQGLPPMGFNTPPPGVVSGADGATPPLTSTFIGVPVIPVQPLSREEKKAFLQRQAAEREARKRQVTTPESDWQFNLQQALDRQAHGLPFDSKSR